MIDIDRACSALFHLDAGCDRSQWARIGMSAKAAGVSAEDWITWSSTAGNFGGERDCMVAWRSFKTGPVGEGTLFRLALDAGWKDDSTYHAPIRKPVEPIPDVPKRERLSDEWKAYWDDLGPVRDAGKSYLKARRCVIPLCDGDLRYDPAARHPCGHVGPCLVALVTDALDCTPISLHRTWVRADGTKADIDKPRLILGDNHRKSGGVIRLWPDDAVCYGLGIAEGIETALTLAHEFKPVWALIDAGNLAKFPVIPYVECLTIAVDNDPAGIKASTECAQRWALEDRDVQLAKSPVAGQDINDAMRGAA